MSPASRLATVIARMSDQTGIRQRVARHSEEAIGKLATELLENSMVSGALSAAFETRASARCARRKQRWGL